MKNEFRHIKCSHTNALIVFVHGLSGSHKTWKNNKVVTIYDYLINDRGTRQNFDFALFRYKSNIININAKIIYLKSFIHGKNEQVLDVDNITNILYAYLTTSGIREKNIIFMAHSLGTIVVKKFILKYKSDPTISNRIKLFFSLASPFYGSELAVIRKSIFPHFKTHNQITIMEPGSDYLSSLNDEWINCPDIPPTFQFVALNDQVVKKVDENYPLNLYRETLITTSDDHFSIIKPLYGKSSIILNKIVDELNAYSSENFYRHLYSLKNPQATTSAFILRFILIGKCLRSPFVIILSTLIICIATYLAIKYF